ncbi:UNVERIFIED_ORG: hypothetical protein BDU10_6865 [Burkholderia sp. CF145]|jgi:hypothetical protein|nr:hypothetical protein PMI06_000876 [Burkholderia sp. BT03]SKD07804.1 hypothetical protein SAMN06266956_10196 [Paraburkholderia hospita]
MATYERGITAVLCVDLYNDAVVLAQPGAEL